MKFVKRLAVILLIPFLLEASFIPWFTISVPGSPLTLGRLAFVALGILGFMINNNSLLLRNQFRWVIFLLVGGSLIGTLFSGNVLSDLVSFAGFALLMLSSIWVAPFFKHSKVKDLLSLFFLGAYIYWVTYILGMTLVGGEIVTYGEIYRANRAEDSSLINYHAFGLILSVSIIYISELRGWLTKFNLFGIGFILLGLLAIFLTESRANLLFTIFTLGYFYVRNNKLQFKAILRIALLLSVFLYGSTYIMSQNERLGRRYDVQNTEYIGQTTESRVVFIGLTFKEFLRLPFGGGVRNTRLNYFGSPYQPHNQYLTFILFAGVIGVIAVLLWFKVFTKTLLRVHAYRLKELRPFIGSVLVLMMVLFTNDLSGAFFLLMLSFQSFVCISIPRKKL